MPAPPPSLAGLLRAASDQAAALQARLESGPTLRALRLGGDLSIALATIALSQGRDLAGRIPWGQAATRGLASGALASAAIAATLNLHKRARNQQDWPQTLRATARETFTGAGSGMASTLAANASILALKGAAVPLMAKAAAPAVAAAVAGWLAQEAAERGLEAAREWAGIPDHAFPEYAPPETPQ